MRKIDRARGLYIREQLRTNPQWAIRALLRIYDRQTRVEQVRGETIQDNGVGFTGTDAKTLTRIAKISIINGKLQSHFFPTLFHRMPKYWRQILSISDVNKIDQLMQRSSNESFA